VAAEKAAVKSALNEGNVKAWTGAPIAGKSVVELAQVARTAGILEGLHKYGKRLGVHSAGGGSIAAGLVKAAFVDLTDADALAEAWGRVVDVINVPLYQEWEEDTRVAIDQIKGRVKYTRLDEHGPKYGPISARRANFCLI
jgi:glycogen debranching enzyme